MNKRIADILEVIKEEHVKESIDNDIPWCLYGNLVKALRDPIKEDRVLWLRNHRKRPNLEAYAHEGTEATWFLATHDSEIWNTSSDLPEEHFSRLKKGRRVANHRSYSTFQEAVLDFIESD